MEWIDMLKVNREIEAAVATPAQPRSDDAALVPELRDAAHRWNKRTDGFADGKASVCLDMAAKVERFGSFATEKQRDYARKLIAWSKPRAGAPAAPAATPMPALFKVMQRHAKFYAGDLTLSRRNADTLVWVKWHGQVVGVIENGGLKLHAHKLGDADKAAVTAMLGEFEVNPLEAAKRYGRESGICCSCGADLTNEDSIAAGIGPICAGRFN